MKTPLTYCFAIYFICKKIEFTGCFFWPVRVRSWYHLCIVLHAKEAVSIMLSDLFPDHVFTGLKAQTRRKCQREIAVRVAAVTGLDASTVARLYSKKEVERGSAIGGGVAVLDFQALRVKRPIFCLAVLDHAVDFGAPDNRPVDLVACVISPRADGPVHLQRISGVSRLLRDPSLCQAVREAKDPDAIRLLLMSPERRLYAA